jgi:phosphoglycerol transferase MdoB-like AlkP superfamily enzyme
MSDGYAPAVISPRIENRLTAQIDLAPTLPGLLNLEYTSKFYDYDILKLETALGDEAIAY